MSKTAVVYGPSVKMGAIPITLGDVSTAISDLVELRLARFQSETRSEALRQVLADYPRLGAAYTSVSFTETAAPHARAAGDRVHQAAVAMVGEDCSASDYSAAVRQILNSDQELRHEYVNR